MLEYTKKRGHHCWWLYLNGRSLANFDEEADVDRIINAQQVLAAIEGALRMGATAAEVLDENSPIRDAVRDALEPPNDKAHL